jgi:hypothetical protein
VKRRERQLTADGLDESRARSTWPDEGWRDDGETRWVPGSPPLVPLHDREAVRRGATRGQRAIAVPTSAFALAKHGVSGWRSAGEGRIPIRRANGSVLCVFIMPPSFARGWPHRNGCHSVPCLGLGGHPNPASCGHLKPGQ